MFFARHCTGFSNTSAKIRGKHYQLLRVSTIYAYLNIKKRNNKK